MESVKRSILKAVSWRIVAVLITITTTLVVTGDITLAFSIGLVDVFVKTTLQVIHDRVWARFD